MQVDLVVVVGGGNRQQGRLSCRDKVAEVEEAEEGLGRQLVRSAGSALGGSDLTISFTMCTLTEQPDRLASHTTAHPILSIYLSISFYNDIIIRRLSGPSLAGASEG